MKKTVFILAGVVSLLLSCAKPPTEDMNRATEALTRAENDSNAVTYAANTLARARTAMNTMRQEADAKRYDAAKTAALEVVTFAERAISEGATAFTRLRDQAAALLASLRQPLSDTEAALNAAKANKVPLEFDALQTGLDSAKANFESAEQSLSAANFADASSKAEAVRAALDDITASINNAAQALSSK